MSPIGERLKDHWSARGIVTPSGVTQRRLREFVQTCLSDEAARCDLSVGVHVEP